jgi:antitoxin (DNA-binding transcriptional repressor) of toxin-antitoxin stability system
MHLEIGSYEAKTKLPELLRGVQAGKRYTITLRGQAVAELIPPAQAQKQAVTSAVQRMQSLMASHLPLRGIDTKALLSQGRD